MRDSANRSQCPQHSRPLKRQRQHQHQGLQHQRLQQYAPSWHRWLAASAQWLAAWQSLQAQAGWQPHHHHLRLPSTSSDAKLEAAPHARASPA
jgi:hypothetical protein